MIVKVQNLNSPINFQKRLVANCRVLKDGAPVDCAIYHLNKAEDKTYFKDLEDEFDWVDADYLSHAEFFLLAGSSMGRTIFALEDEDENCLGFVSTNLQNQKKNTIEVIETVNRKTSPVDYRTTYKYIGETLVSFLAQLTELNPDKKKLCIDTPQTSALPFYISKLGFRPSKKEPKKRLVLKRPDFQNLLKQNETHTASKIDLVF